MASIDTVPATDHVPAAQHTPSNDLPPAALLDAVKNGQLDVVKDLLDKGVDPAAAFAHGHPEQYTSDPAIIDVLRAALLKGAPQSSFPDDKTNSPSQFPPQHDTYTYYPTINPSLSTLPDPNYFYQPHTPSQPAPDGSHPNGLGNLPPPEIARLIPCRYFPACRYGAQCMFAHPPGPFYQGPAPPVQYPPYEPMGNPYMGPYYPAPAPPASFQQPPPVHPVPPLSPPAVPPIMHTRSPSEVISAPAPFSPNGVPPPPPPPPGPFAPLSPQGYPHPGPVPIPIPGPPLHPAAHPQPPLMHPNPQSPPNMYNPTAPPPPPFVMQPDAVNGFPGPVPLPKPTFPDVNGAVKAPDGQGENFAPHNTPREGPSGPRRGNARRPSFGTRKPPCLFFPAGRCKNGDDCRFPHVLADSGAPAPAPAFPNGRSNGPRPRPQAQPANGTNGLNGIDAKLGNMTIRDDQPRHKNGTDASARPHINGGGKFAHNSNGRQNHVNGNGGNHHHPNHKKAALPKQQRVPSADDFPVLAGTITPPNRPLLNGTNGQPTAAQVLQAARPARKENASKESSTRGTTPEVSRSPLPKDTEVNGIVNHENDTPVKEPVVAPSAAISAATTTTTSTPAPVTTTTATANTNPVVKPTVMTFAAAAAAPASSTADVAKEVSVSA